MPRDEEARKKYLEEYYKKPEVIARRKKYFEEYGKRPEVVARRKEILKKYNSSSKGKNKMKKYNSSSKGLENRKKYAKSPKGAKVHRKVSLMWKYKISEQRYFEILEKQIGLCAICGSDSPKRKGSENFAVDHNHTTMEVRGLLCHPCNVMLGMAKDNIEVLEKAVKYLKCWKK